MDGCGEQKDLRARPVAWMIVRDTGEPDNAMVVG